MKCDVCGMELDLEEAFIKLHRPFHRSDLTLCPGCKSRNNTAHSSRYLITVFVGGFIGYLLLWQNIWPNVGELLTTIFLLNLFLILSIVPHELGHAIVAQLLGWRVFTVMVGLGKKVFQFELSRIIFTLHSLPIAGRGTCAPINGRYVKTKFFFIILAGPAVNAIIATIILFIWRHEGGVPHAAQLCVIANVWILIMNLAPRHSKILNTDTDGKQLIGIFFKKQDYVEELRSARYAGEAMVRRDEYDDIEDWCNKGLTLFPQNFHLLNVRGILYLEEQNYGRAREIFLQLLLTETKPGLKRYVILNNIAYADVLADNPELLPEADAYSTEAYNGLPSMEAIIGTRGTVLVEIGQIEGGIKLLTEAFNKHATPSNRASTACYLAIAYARMGDRVRAEKYLGLTKQLDPKCPLIARAQAELA